MKILRRQLAVYVPGVGMGVAGRSRNFQYANFTAVSSWFDSQFNHQNKLNAAEICLHSGVAPHIHVGWAGNLSACCRIQFHTFLTWLTCHCVAKGRNVTIVLIANVGCGFLRKNHIKHAMQYHLHHGFTLHAEISNVERFVPSCLQKDSIQHLC